MVFLVAYGFRDEKRTRLLRRSIEIFELLVLSEILLSQTMRHRSEEMLVGNSDVHNYVHQVHNYRN